MPPQLSLQVKIDSIWIDKINCRQLESTTALFFWLKKKDPCKPQGDEEHDLCSSSAHSLDSVTEHISINKTVVLPYTHPKISRILDQSFTVKIIKAEVRSTPLSSHCCKLPIRKVIIKGKVEILIKYESISPSQDVHAFTFDLPLCALVEWIGGPPPYSPICIEVTPEHFQVDCLDGNHLFCVLLLHLDIYRQY